METVNYIFQIAANIFVIFGAIFAIYQYSKQKKLTKIDNAIAISKYFATNMLHKVELVYSVFVSEPKIMGIIKKHEPEIQAATDFTKEEYERIFSETERDTYNDFIEGAISLPNGKKIPIEQLMGDVMNEFEHCCTSFNTGLAEDTAVYQSLHQIILSIFPCFYPHICSINEDPIDQYFTNLSELYIRWNSIKEKALKKQAKSNAKIQKMKNKSKNSGQVKRPKV